MASMKQGTLSFASAKRNNSAPNGKKSSVAEKGKNKQVETLVKTRDDAKPSVAIEIYSDEKDAASAKTSVPVKRTREGMKTRSSAAPKQPQVSPSEKAQPSRAEVERDHLDIEGKGYRKYYNEVRSKMGYMQPVHSEGQNKIHLMLRFFDMSYEYGPCIGMTRLARWKRAEALGLNPPVEVRDILLTKEGIERDEYAQCVLQGEV